MVNLGDIDNLHGYVDFEEDFGVKESARAEAVYSKLTGRTELEGGIERGKFEAMQHWFSNPAKDSEKAAAIRRQIDSLKKQLISLSTGAAQRRGNGRKRKAAAKRAKPATEPDFLGRAKAIWGESPAGKPLSALVSEARG